MGRIVLTDDNSKQFVGYQEFFRVACGLVVKDDRCVMRLANIETTGSSNILDEDNLIKLINRMPRRGAGAVIYCNQDNILNDDKYDYDTIGYPFMRSLGRKIYDYERSRQREHTPDLSAFRFKW
jgi:hypothetical protein